MEQKTKYNLNDLDVLIDEKVNHCKGLPEVCRMLGNDVGKSRIKARVKEMVLGGLSDIDACLAQIESQLAFETE